MFKWFWTIVDTMYRGREVVFSLGGLSNYDGGRLQKCLLLKGIRAVSNFIVLIPTLLICPMLTISSGVDFLRTASKFTKRRKKSLSCVCVRRPRATKANKCTKKRMMHEQSCCFAINLNLLLLFGPSRFRRPRRCFWSRSRLNKLKSENCSIDKF